MYIYLFIYRYNIYIYIYIYILIIEREGEGEREREREREGERDVKNPSSIFQDYCWDRVIQNESRVRNFQQELINGKSIHLPQR